MTMQEWKSDVDALFQDELNMSTAVWDRQFPVDWKELYETGLDPWEAVKVVNDFWWSKMPKLG